MWVWEAKGACWRWDEIEYGYESDGKIDVYVGYELRIMPSPVN